MLLDLWMGFMTTDLWVAAVASTAVGGSPDVWITVGNLTQSEGSWAGRVYDL